MPQRKHKGPHLKRKTPPKDDPNAFPRRAAASLGFAGLSVLMMILIASAPDWTMIVLPLFVGVMIVGLVFGFGSITRRERPPVIGKIAVSVNVLVPVVFAIFALLGM